MCGHFSARGLGVLVILLYFLMCQAGGSELGVLAAGSDCTSWSFDVFAGWWLFLLLRAVPSSWGGGGGAFFGLGRLRCWMSRGALG